AASVMEEVDDEEVVPCEGDTSGIVVVGVTTVGKEMRRVRIEDASIGREVGTTIGIFTNGIVEVKMGETEVDIFVVETRRDVNVSSIKIMSDDETDEDDTISGIDGRSKKEARRDESISNNGEIFKDKLSEDGGISEFNEVGGSSDSVDVFVDGLVLEEYSSIEMKLI
ncbi:hypothetical protein KI387_028182, partial [Taxus chinensis]